MFYRRVMHECVRPVAMDGMGDFQGPPPEEEYEVNP